MMGIARTFARRNANARAIKEGIDHLPDGVAFARENGLLLLYNVQMDRVCRRLFGMPLQNASLFWERVLLGSFPSGARLAELRKSEVVVETGARHWHLRRTAVRYHGETVFQITAHDVTELWLLNAEIGSENDLLARQAEELRAYAHRARQLTADRELVARKEAVHDELGALLSRSHAALRSGDAELVGADGLWARWRLNAEVLLGGGRKERAADGSADLLGQLCETASSVGVSLEVSGDLPRTGHASELLLAAGGESLANAMRHARAGTLSIRGTRLDHGWSCQITNDGSAPEGPIAEGGGLVALRAKVEDAGGSMLTEWWPAYRLTVLLPDEREGEGTDA